MSLKMEEVIAGEFYQFKITGRLYILELIHGICGLWEGSYQLSDTVSELWDLSEAELSHLSFDKAEELSSEIQRLIITFKPGKVAILLPDSAEKHLASYLMGLLEKNRVREINIFHEPQEAYNFLGYKMSDI